MANTHPPWSSSSSLVLSFLIIIIIVQVSCVCVWQSDPDGKRRIDCGFKQTGIVRLGSVGGVKGWAGLGLSAGDEVGTDLAINAEKAEAALALKQKKDTKAVAARQERQFKRRSYRRRTGQPSAPAPTENVGTGKQITISVPEFYPIPREGLEQWAEMGAKVDISSAEDTRKAIAEKLAEEKTSARKAPEPESTEVLAADEVYEEEKIVPLMERQMQQQSRRRRIQQQQQQQQQFNSGRSHSNEQGGGGDLHPAESKSDNPQYTFKKLKVNRYAPPKSLNTKIKESPLYGIYSLLGRFFPNKPGQPHGPNFKPNMKQRNPPFQNAIRPGAIGGESEIVTYYGPQQQIPVPVDPSQLDSFKNQGWHFANIVEPMNAAELSQALSKDQVFSTRVAPIAANPVPTSPSPAATDDKSKYAAPVSKNSTTNSTIPKTPRPKLEKQVVLDALKTLHSEAKKEILAAIINDDQFPEGTVVRIATSSSTTTPAPAPSPDQSRLSYRERERERDREWERNRERERERDRERDRDRDRDYYNNRPSRPREPLYRERERERYEPRTTTPRSHSYSTYSPLDDTTSESGEESVLVPKVISPKNPLMNVIIMAGKRNKGEKRTSSSAAAATGEEKKNLSIEIPRKTGSQTSKSKASNSKETKGGPKSTTPRPKAQQPPAAGVTTTPSSRYEIGGSTLSPLAITLNELGVIRKLMDRTLTKSQLEIVQSLIKLNQQEEEMIKKHPGVTKSTQRILSKTMLEGVKKLMAKPTDEPAEMESEEKEKEKESKPEKTDKTTTKVHGKNSTSSPAPPPWYVKPPEDFKFSPHTWESPKTTSVAPHSWYPPLSEGQHVPPSDLNEWFESIPAALGIPASWYPPTPTQPQHPGHSAEKAPVPQGQGQHHVIQPTWHPHPQPGHRPVVESHVHYVYPQNAVPVPSTTASHGHHQPHPTQGHHSQEAFAHHHHSHSFPQGQTHYSHHPEAFVHSQETHGHPANVHVVPPPPPGQGQGHHSQEFQGNAYHGHPASPIVPHHPNVAVVAPLVPQPQGHHPDPVPHANYANVAPPPPQYHHPNSIPQDPKDNHYENQAHFQQQQPQVHANSYPHVQPQPQVPHTAPYDQSHVVAPPQPQHQQSQGQHHQQWYPPQEQHHPAPGLQGQYSEPQPNWQHPNAQQGGHQGHQGHNQHSNAPGFNQQGNQNNVAAVPQNHQMNGGQQGQGHQNNVAPQGHYQNSFEHGHPVPHTQAQAQTQTSYGNPATQGQYQQHQGPIGQHSIVQPVWQAPSPHSQHGNISPSAAPAPTWSPTTQQSASTIFYPPSLPAGTLSTPRTTPMYPNSYTAEPVNPNNYQDHGHGSSPDQNKNFDHSQTHKINSAEHAANYGFQSQGQGQGQTPFAPSWIQHDWTFNSKPQSNQNQYPNPQGFSSRSGEVDLSSKPAAATKTMTSRRSDSESSPVESSLVDMSALIGHIG